MARVLALVPDLLFGSRVQGALTAAGHEVELIGGEGELRKRLNDAAAPAAAVLVVDLTNEDLDGARVLRSLSGEGGLGFPGEGGPAQMRTLGFYSHVDARARERAQQAGFDLVVPRSRMAREGDELVTRLASS
jgi:DNA-binding NarL/FixJ family response regulator